LIPGRVKRVLSSQQRPEHIWDTPSLLPNKVPRAVSPTREADHSSKSCALVKTGRATPPVLEMSSAACRLIN
jgi:hypothetical protein